jgi:starch synthase
VEFWGQVGLMKAGISYADRITTVSPTYAAEIQGPELGFGLDGLLRHRSARLTGILNGVDTGQWDPSADPAIVAPFSAADLDAKAVNKAALRQAFGLDATAPGPFFAVVSRLTEQKGIDLLLANLPRLVDQGGQLAVLGSGGRAMEEAMAAAARDHPGRVGIRLGYDEALAHRIQAGADVMLVPSRFEPCGLTQMYALRYGTLPLVSRVGGLADTVTDVTDHRLLDDALADGTATGFVFHPVTADALGAAIDRVFALWRRPALWRRAQLNAMARDVGWDASARRYAALYREIMDEKTRRA